MAGEPIQDIEMQDEERSILGDNELSSNELSADYEAEGQDAGEEASDQETPGADEIPGHAPNSALASYAVPIEDPETGEVLGEWSYADIVSAYRNRNKRDANAQGDGQNDMTKYIPVLEQVDNSPLAQYIVFHRIRGYTDDEIWEHLANSHTSRKQDKGAKGKAGAKQQEPDESSLWDTEEPAPSDEADARIAELQREIQAIRNDQSASQITSHNDHVLYNALMQAGHDPSGLTDQDRLALRESIQGMLPGVDLKRYQLSPLMAQAMVERGMGVKPTTKGEKQRPQNAQTIQKLRSLPKHAPAGGGGKAAGQPRGISENGYTRGEKRRRIDEFLRTGKLPL